MVGVLNTSLHSEILLPVVIFLFLIVKDIIIIKEHTFKSFAIACVRPKVLKCLFCLYIEMSTTVENQQKAKQYYTKLMDAGYYKEYYHTNLKQPLSCECGHSVTKANLSRHRKTKAHNQIMTFRSSMNQDTARTVTVPSCVLEEQASQ
jgi:hypothetical protein